MKGSVAFQKLQTPFDFSYWFKKLTDNILWLLFPRTYLTSESLPLSKTGKKSANILMPKYGIIIFPHSCSYLVHFLNCEGTRLSLGISQSISYETFSVGHQVFSLILFPGLPVLQLFSSLLQTWICFRMPRNYTKTTTDISYYLCSDYFQYEVLI